eukprot:CAMPEP_0172591240 /NCGR_PEP_ID=MMETSP1068-20121228/9924_1 /TAXON_ID=35684 /ORGANISM="Pseudopedinella elastica, Strain CCMP716" /LENGTH=185 /DNA_ID=CAMNT_0013387545 /DNA_START=67 /DNA_END=624 /DNA_ORIENTATION=-
MAKNGCSQKPAGEDAKLLPDSYQVDIQDSEPAVIVEDIPWFRRRSALAAIITLGAFCMISAGAILLAPNSAAIEGSSPSFCCYSWTKDADTCGTCNSMDDSSNWCTQDENHCATCGGTYCDGDVSPSSTPPSPPPPPPPSGDSSPDDADSEPANYPSGKKSADSTTTDDDIVKLRMHSADGGQVI